MPDQRSSVRALCLLLWILPLLVGLTGCPRAFRGAEANLPPEIEIGGKYYTRHSFQYEKNRHRTTNYRRGLLVPVNTQVALVSFGRKGQQGGEGKTDPDRTSYRTVGWGQFARL